ncbi:MAG: exosortase system-associated protein, TIGR04073 family [Candidatus Omnitrophota bacterium]
MCRFHVAFVAVIIAILFFAVSNAYAYEYHAGTKLGRGIANSLSGWVEVFKQPSLTLQEYEPALLCLFFGSVKGLFYAVVRTATGVFDVVTFVIPPYDTPIIQPEFVLEGW